MFLIRKLALTFKALHGIVSYEMYLFITTAERISNFDLDDRFEYSFFNGQFLLPFYREWKMSF
jgi:hypothetical protein